MIKKILLGLAATVVLFLLVVAVQPEDFRVERSATIAASPSELFDQVNDHKKFQKWNPWDKMDPEAKTTFSGADSGVGAVARWDGAKVGAGSATIIESKPGELVRQRMDWVKPMKGTSTVDFSFKPEGDKTVVTWAMYGKNGFMGKAMSLFMSCEKMCGPEFEKGLRDLAIIVADKPVN